MVAAEQAIEAAKARLTTAQARQREAVAKATKAATDVERFKPLLAKDEISQQQFDAAVAAGECGCRRGRIGAALVVEAELACAWRRAGSCRHGERAAGSARS